MPRRTRYETVQRVVCGYDFLALVPLAIPLVTGIHLATLGSINAYLGGDFWPGFDPIQLMFAQMLGVIATGWTFWRWLNLSRAIGRFEGFLRLFVAASLLLVFAQTGQPLLLIFGLVDIGLGSALIFGSRWN
jgi:small neutral amino acid transporter SnatA (MarC family)